MKKIFKILAPLYQEMLQEVIEPGFLFQRNYWVFQQPHKNIELLKGDLLLKVLCAAINNWLLHVKAKGGHFE